MKFLNNNLNKLIVLMTRFEEEFLLDLKRKMNEKRFSVSTLFKYFSICVLFIQFNSSRF